MPNTLDQLMALAIKDRRKEQAFFQALLEATVYAHVPIEDRLNTNRIRFIQFHRPENGQLVLPFFTDEEKARLAAGKTARIAVLTGRYLLELTRGATLMLNPNDTQCVLYPEEIETLLRTGYIAAIEKFTVQKGAEPIVGQPIEDAPAWLMDALTTALAKLPYVQLAYIAGLYRSSEQPEQTGFVIALSGDKEYAERAIHAVTTVIQPLCQKHNGPLVDMTHFDHAREPPEWITNLQLRPFYDRSWGSRLQQGTDPSSNSFS